MSNPFFSVVIPTYNRVNTLKKAIQSVIDQSFSDFELLIIDDGSTDFTKQMVLNINDSRIKYEWMCNSGGPAKPRNRAISQAKGKWICFLDADDWWHVDKLRVCYNKINDEVDIIYHDLVIVDSLNKSNIKLKKSRNLHKPILIDLLIRGNTINNSSVVVRKLILNQVGEIDERKEMIASEDYNLWLRIAKISDKFLYIPQNLGFYLVHESNLSDKDMSLNWELACSDFFKLLNNRQANILKADIKYFRARRDFLLNNYYPAYVNLKFCLKNGKPMIILKSFYMLFFIFLKLLLINK